MGFNLKFYSTIVITFLLLFTSSFSVLAMPTKQELVEQFDKNLAWLNKETINRPYYVFSLTHPLHHVNIDLVPVTQAYKNLPEGISFVANEQFRGYHIAINETLNKVFLSESLDFSNATPAGIGAEAHPITQWFIADVNQQQVTFQYGFMYMNAWIAEALLSMYDITSNDIYLDQARDILWSTVRFIEPNGKFLRRFNTASDFPGYYNGMTQGILMRVLYSYLSKKPDTSLNGAFCHMAEGYVHTAEGVWNHWTNSMIGGILKDRAFGTNEVNHVYIRQKLNTLYGYINEFGGKIPKEMKRTAPYFPSFSESYQTYDVYLLALLQGYLSISTDFDKSEYYRAFELAKNVNYDHYFGNNTKTLYLQRKHFGIRDDQFANLQATLLTQSPSAPVDAVGNLNTAAALASYWYENATGGRQYDVLCK